MRKISPTTSYLDQSRSWIKRPPDIIGADLFYFYPALSFSDPSISKIVWTIFVKIRYQIKKLKGTLTQVRLLMRHLFGLNHIPEESKSNLLFKKKFKKALSSNRPSKWVIRRYIEGSSDMIFRWIISDWVCRSRRSVYRLSKSWSKRLLEVCCSSSAAGQAQANIFIRRTSYFETWFVLLAFSKPPFILSQQNFPNQTKLYSQTNPTIWGPNLKYFRNVREYSSYWRDSTWTRFLLWATTRQSKVTWISSTHFTSKIQDITKTDWSRRQQCYI